MAVRKQRESIDTTPYRSFSQYTGVWNRLPITAGDPRGLAPLETSGGNKRQQQQQQPGGIVMITRAVSTGLLPVHPGGGIQGAFPSGGP